MSKRFRLWCPNSGFHDSHGSLWPPFTRPPSSPRSFSTFLLPDLRSGLFFSYTGTVNGRGERHGTGTCIYLNGDCYEGEWQVSATEWKKEGECCGKQGYKNRNKQK